MLKARMLLSVVAVGVTVPAVAHAQLPQVPQPSQVTQAVQVPQAPQLPPVPAGPAGAQGAGPGPSRAASGARAARGPQAPGAVLAGGRRAAAVASSGGGGGSAASGGGSSAAPSGGGRSTSASSGGGSSTGGGGTTRRSHVVGSDGAGESRTPVQRRRAERRLQRAVARLGGCLDELAPTQQRVLELRAGVGAGPPRTRRGVARVMDIRVKQVWRLERRGLRNARAVARSDSCGSAAAGGATIALPSGASGPDGTWPGGGGDTPEASAGPARRTAPRTAPTAPRPGSPASPAANRPSSAPPAFGNAGARRESATGTSLWVAVGLMLLAALAGFATPSLRDRLREGPPASAGHL